MEHENIKARPMAREGIDRRVEKTKREERKRWRDKGVKKKGKRRKEGKGKKGKKG